METKSPGYDDTPVLPGSTYRVHDSRRTQPRVVAPGHGSNAPMDAVVLFDGSSLTGWESVKGGPAGWRLDGGAMEVVPGTGDIQTRQHFGDCQIHLEFATPTVVKGDSQGRGNSGVFLMGLYEIQVLDCFENPTYADGTTGAVYGQYPPLVNACRRPGEWQAYDILWRGPRFEGERLAAAAVVTVMFNGVAVQHATVPQGPTQHRQLAEYRPHPPTGPLRLQDHGDQVRFRHIWYRPLGDRD
jgi:hypothetical protein